MLSLFCDAVELPVREVRARRGVAFEETEEKMPPKITARVSRRQREEFIHAKVSAS
jgi:hypothetical protein